LDDRGLVQSAPNPADKRSSLITLTDSGRRIFETMQEKESEILAGAIAAFSHSELTTTEQTLAKLAEHFSNLLEHATETKNDD
jgi:DNA-binding MarR family transcriptional regulator